MRPGSPTCAPVRSPRSARGTLRGSDSKVLGHVGARGTAYWNVRLLDHLFDFDEIRVHSRRPESRDAFAERLAADLGKPVVATSDWESCVRGADIVVEASRLSKRRSRCCAPRGSQPGALVIPYGTMSAVELDLTDIMSKVVVDDWGQCASGQFGALRAHVEAGKLSAATLHAELGEIVAGPKPGRERDDETILLLASRPVAVRHCARLRDAGQGRAARNRPDARLPLATRRRRVIPGSACTRVHSGV